jgi:hypothetical protein
MTEYDQEPLSSVGAELISHANEFGSPNRLPLITQLFPFLLLASRRMTTREMSDWLSKEKGVKLSAPMITKGLKRPDLHLKRIAEHVQPLAAFVCAVHQLDVEGLLFGEDPRTGVSELADFADAMWGAPDEVTSDSVRESLRVLMEFWEPIPQEVKLMTRRYFDFSDDSHAADTEEETSNPDDEQ